MNLPDFDDLAPSRDAQHCSVGFVCQLLQILPGQLRVLMDDLAIRFSMVLDGVPYIGVADSERLAERCSEVRKEIQSVRDSVANN